MITPGDEKRRERIITRDDEIRLLAECRDKREHLRPIIICALDSGMRKGEILKLVPSDLDFENRVISVRAFNTKTMRERQVAMTERLATELARIVQHLPGDSVLLFGIRDDFKKAFVSYIILSTPRRAKRTPRISLGFSLTGGPQLFNRGSPLKRNAALSLGTDQF